MVSGSPSVRPCATRIGSTSPIRSPTLVSGVASFSPYRIERCSQADRQVVADLGGRAARRRGDRVQRVLVELGAGDHRGPLVEQLDQRADQPGLALAALAEQHHVVAGQDRPLDLGQHRVVVADDAGEARLTGAHPGQQVVAQLLLDRAVDVAGGAQLADGAGQVAGCWFGHLTDASAGFARSGHPTGRPSIPDSAVRAGSACGGRPARTAYARRRDPRRVPTDGRVRRTPGGGRRARWRRRARPAPPAGPSTIASATIRLRVTIGPGATTASTPYSPRICGQSVSCARGASSCTAAMAAWSWYGPSAAVDRAVADQRDPLGDRAGVPARPVLLGQRHERAVRPGARRPPGVGEQHEREQAGDLAVAGQPGVQLAGQPDRLRGQVGAVQGGARAGRVALVEDQVQHVQHRADAAPRAPPGAASRTPRRWP